MVSKSLKQFIVKNIKQILVGGGGNLWLKIHVWCEFILNRQVSRLDARPNYCKQPNICSYTSMKVTVLGNGLYQFLQNQGKIFKELKTYFWVVWPN